MITKNDVVRIPANSQFCGKRWHILVLRVVAHRMNVTRGRSLGDDMARVDIQALIAGTMQRLAGDKRFICQTAAQVINCPASRYFLFIIGC